MIHTAVGFVCLMCVMFSIERDALSVDVITYNLTEEKIEKIGVVESRESRIYSLIIQLNEEYKKEFSKVTGGNIGRILSVCYQGRELLQSIVNVPVTSGAILVLQTHDKSEAYNLLKELSD